ASHRIPCAGSSSWWTPTNTSAARLRSASRSRRAPSAATGARRSSIASASASGRPRAASGGRRQDTMMRAFRFGVFGENARTPEALLDTARRAEQAGYATFLIRDHFIEEPFGHQLAPLTALATVAAATTSLRIGSLVLSNDYRHPAMLAKEIATLDALSG